MGLSSRSKRFLVTLLVFLLLFLFLGYAISFLIVPFRTELQRLLTTIDVRHGSLHGAIQSLSAWYRDLPPDARDFVSGQLDLFGPRLQEWTRSLLKTTLEWIGHIVELVTIPVLAFYFVLDARSLKREFLYLIPRRRIREAVLIMREAAQILQTYTLAQLILCFIAAVVVGVGLGLMGIRYALTLAVLAGITRAIPILGPIFGGIPIVLLAGLQSVEKGAAVLIFFSLLHLIESKIIMPKLLGDRMRLHPAILLIVLLAGAELFGVLGMFLAAPVAALFKVLYDFYVLSRHRPRRRTVVIPLELPVETGLSKSA
jgi:predicted PurR-regulated permease PerM